MLLHCFYAHYTTLLVQWKAFLLQEKQIFCFFRAGGLSFPSGPVGKADPVGDQGNEFRICGLPFSRVYGIAEKGIQRFHPASAPG